MSESRATRALLWVVSACALTTTALVVKREFKRPAEQQDSRLATEEIRDWKAVATGADTLFHSENPSLVITVFSDFQCTFCRQLQAYLVEFVNEYPGRLLVLYRHLPLEAIHPDARRAAAASKCAGAQGRFREYHDKLFESQDSIGRLPWVELAARAGVADLEAFSACRATPSIDAAITGDVEAARALRIQGTPAVLLGGLLVRGLPPTAEFRRLVASRIAIRT